MMSNHSFTAMEMNVDKVRRKKLRMFLFDLPVVIFGLYFKLSGFLKEAVGCRMLRHFILFQRLL